MNRSSAAFVALSLLLSSLHPSLVHAQTNTDPNRGVARIGQHEESHSASGHATESHSKPADPLPKFSGNLPSSINEDRTHGVNAPGTLIGPSPENGQPDPRFPNDPATSGGGSEINNRSPSAGAAQTTTGSDKMSGAGQSANQSGGTTSNLNEGLPSASMDNSGANSGGASGGTGGGAGGKEYNAGGDARPGVGASQSRNGSSDVGRETRGAAPYAIGAGAVIIGAFLFAVMRGRKRRLGA